MSSISIAEHVRKAVEKGSQEALATERRGHLGASQIGNRCARSLWYAFRWYYQEKHTGRLLRLFNRGHEEEVRLTRWLRAAGYEIREYAQRLWLDSEGKYHATDWEETHDSWLDVSSDPAHINTARAHGVTLEQWGFSAHDGHFGGSTDGKIRGPHLPDGWGGVEYKTMSDKSYKETLNKGVLSSKPVYYVQMQVYMRMLNLPWYLFVAVNKNDDEIYYEIVYAKPEIADQYIDLAKKIIEAQQPPPRFANDPSWFECRYCAFREICHYNEVPQKNCRSCSLSVASYEGRFYCQKFYSAIPFDFQPKGCEHWQPV